MKVLHCKVGDSFEGLSDDEIERCRTMYEEKRLG